MPLKYFTQFAEDDGLPPNVCAKCLLNVSKLHSFRRQCLRSDASLRETHHPEVRIEKQPVSIKKEAPPSPRKARIAPPVKPEKETEPYNKNMVVVDEKDESIEILDVSIDDEEEESQENESRSLDTEDNESMEYVTVMVAENDNDFEEEVSISVLNMKKERDSLEIGEGADDKKVQKNRRPSRQSFKCNECGKILSNFGSYKYHRQLQ